MPNQAILADITEETSTALKIYNATIPMGSLAIGVDNIHHDVFLSPQFVQAARDYLFDLIRQSTSAAYFPGIELRPVKALDSLAFRKMVTALLQSSLTQGKHRKNAQIDHLFRLALLKFLTQEISNQFSNIILEGKEWVRQRGEHFERSQQAHVIKARLSELQLARRNVLRGVGQHIRQMLADIEENVLAKSRRALFGDDFPAVYEILKNRIIFLDGGKDELFFLDNYVLLGNYARDPDRFEALDALFQELVREAGIAVSQDPAFAEAHQAHTELLNQAHAAQKEIVNLEEQRENLAKRVDRGDGIFSRIMGGGEPGDLRASLADIEQRLKVQQVKLEEMGPQMEAAKQKVDFFHKDYAGRLGDYLNEPGNAARLFDASGAGESAAPTCARLLEELIERLEQGEALFPVLASYEIRPLVKDYSPPVHLQQLRKALVSREELKRVEQILKQFPARPLPLKPLEELAKKMHRYSREEISTVILRFAGDFMRLHRDLRDAEHLTACMERIHLVTTEKARELSRMNNSLYECLLQTEARPEQDQVLAHSIIKADVRGSTKLTQDLIARGLNPASYFSLNLHEPVKKLLERYSAKKVFIEGDAIILAVFETESNQAYQRPVAKACALARQIVAVSGAYNERSAAGDLPRLEIGVGVAFQGSAPTYWVDGDSRIMISKALNLSDRLSGSTKLAKRLLEKQKTLFSLYQFLNVLEGASADELDEFLIRYNLNGIELNAEGFVKLSEEISLEMVQTKLEMPWGKSDVTLYYGEVPLGESLELIVIRKGLAREILPNGTIGRASDHAYYEVCTHPKLYDLVAALLRSNAAQIVTSRR